MLCSLARDHVIDTTLHVYGVAAVPEDDDEEIGKLVIITEAGVMNALQVRSQHVPRQTRQPVLKATAGALSCLNKKPVQRT